MDILKRCHGTKRVFANNVYQEYIKDKNHIHMNATRWCTLSGFVQYLGSSGKCKIEDTDKGKVLKIFKLFICYDIENLKMI